MDAGGLVRRRADGRGRAASGWPRPTPAAASCSTAIRGRRRRRGTLDGDPGRERSAAWTRCVMLEVPEEVLAAPGARAAERADDREAEVVRERLRDLPREDGAAGRRYYRASCGLLRAESTATGRSSRSTALRAGGARRSEQMVLKTPGEIDADGRGEPHRPRGAGRHRREDPSGRHDRRARPLRGGAHPRRGRGAGLPALQGLPGDALHLDQRRDRARHPGRRALRRGRHLLGIDCGVVYKGYYGDAARTFPVGSDRSGSRAADRGHAAGARVAVEQVRPDRRLSDIGHAVQSYVEAHGFSVVRDFVGHGIGTALHEDPQVPNFGDPGRGPRLKPGLVLAIEPMVNAGGPAVRGGRGRLDGAARRTDRCRRTSSTRWR